MAAYVISDIDIHEIDELREYVARVPALIEPYGGRYIVRRGKLETLEGTWHPKAVVVVEFPTVEKAEEWYGSAEYQEPKRDYFKGATRNLVLLEGL